MVGGTGITHHASLSHTQAEDAVNSQLGALTSRCDITALRCGELIKKPSLADLKHQSQLPKMPKTFWVV